jgi:hypothetical protein
MNTRGRKPIPKTQKEISKSLQNPYDLSGPGFQPIGNPNDTAYDKNERGNQVSFKGDTEKAFTLGIQDIDDAVVYYITNIIKPSIIHNEVRINVPLLYGDSEKWNTIQKQGYYRDKSGKMMLPLIIFKRNSIERNRNLSNKLDANFPNNMAVTSKSYNKNNAYCQFNVLNKKLPEKQYYITVIPDWVTVNYDFVVSTYYIEQMNSILEAINYSSDSYWGDPKKFLFQSYIDSISTNTSSPVDEERFNKSTFSLKLHGYIIPSILQKDLASIKKVNDKVQINFFSETVFDINNI